MILSGLPKISGRGGDGALEGPGPWETVSPSGRASGAALSAGFATPSSEAVAGVAEDTPRAVIALVAVGVAGAAFVVSDRPPTLGGSVASGTGAALSMGACFFFGGTRQRRRNGSGSRVRDRHGLARLPLPLLVLLFLLLLGIPREERGREVRRKVTQE
jgi:hypothetical protein